MGLRKKIVAILGLTLVAVAVANVEFGALIGTEPPQKVILARLADPGCTADEIQKDLDEGTLNECVTSPGVWDAADLLLVAEGAFLFLTTFMRWPRKGRWALRIRKISIVVGVLLCSIALADRFDSLPGTSSEDLAALLPFPAPAIAVQIGIFAAGIFLLRGPKYVIEDYGIDKKDANRRNTIHQEMDQTYSKGGSLGRLGKNRPSTGLGRYDTVGDLHKKQGLSMYEDAFETGLKDDMKSKVGRACHLCNGQGCASCSNSGIAA